VKGPDTEPRLLGKLGNLGGKKSLEEISTWVMVRSDLASVSSFALVRAGRILRLSIGDTQGQGACTMMTFRVTCAKQGFLMPNAGGDGVVYAAVQHGIRGPMNPGFSPRTGNTGTTGNMILSP
jgi:hypothetical protein